MVDRRIDVRRELNDAPPRRFHWLLVVLIFIGITFDGYDTFTPVYVIHFVIDSWELSEAQAGFLMSSGLIGFAVGSVTHGVVADRIGRRPTLIAGLFIAGLFSLLTGLFGHSFAVFIALRVLTGLGLGILMPLGTAFLNEYLPAAVRQRFAALGQFGFACGAVVASVVGILYTRAAGWEVLYWIGAGAIAVAALYLLVLPESVEHLVTRGKQAEAVRLLSRIRPERMRSYSETGLQVSAEAARGDWQLPIRRRYLGISVALWASSFLLLFDIYGLSSWTPELLIERGLGFAAVFGSGAVLQGMSLVGGLVCAYLVDRRIGRRWALALWCGLGAVAAVAVAFVDTTASNLLLIAAAGFFIIGAQYVLNNECAMSYPVYARGTGQGYMLGFGRVGGILGPYIGGVLLGSFGGTSVLFVAVAIAAGVAVISTSFVANLSDKTSSSPHIPGRRRSAAGRA